MRKKTIGVVICTLVIATFFAPITGSANISVKHGSSDPIYGTLNPQAKFAFSNRGSNLNNWGITEPINLGSVNTVRMIYFQRYDISAGSSDKGYVKISNNGGSSWTTLWEVQGTVGEWQLNMFDISEYSGDTVLIAFHYVTGEESISQGWSVDKITVEADDEYIFVEDFEEYNVNDPWEDWIIWADLNPTNYPPYPPKIEGPSTGGLNKPVTFYFRTSDPDLDSVSYYIEWGDGSLTDWTEFFPSGAAAYDENHIWAEEGTFTIRAKAKDINNAESTWTEHTIKIKKGRDRQSDNLILIKLLERLFVQMFKTFPILNKVF